MTDPPALTSSCDSLRPNVRSAAFRGWRWREGRARPHSSAYEEGALMLRWVDWKLSVAATMSFGCSSGGRELQTLQEIKRGLKSKKKKKEGVRVGERIKVKSREMKRERRRLPGLLFVDSKPIPAVEPSAEGSAAQTAKREPLGFPY